MLKQFSILMLQAAVFTACMPTLSFAQPRSSVSNNIERAFNVINDAYTELNYSNTVGDVKMHVKGLFNYTGEPDNPGSVREYTVSGHINFARGGMILERKDTFTRIGQDPITSLYDISDDKMNIIVANENMKATSADREKYLYQSLIFSPNLLLQYMLRDASRNTYISSDDKFHIVRHNNASGDCFFLYVDTKTYYLDHIDQPMYEAGIGDYYRTIKYGKYDIQDGYQTPGSITISIDSNIIYKLDIELEEMLPQVDYGMMRLSQKKIGSWLFLVPMPEWNSKSVIADMNEYLVVFEPPATSEASYTLLDNIKKAYPGKEIRYCVVSHHHPEVNGGIRPFMEEGITIVTTEGNKEYFQNIARNRHMFSKEVRLKKFMTPKFLFVTTNQQEIRTRDHIIQFYLLNKKSHHTDEYILSYIPTDKILIEGDLVKTTNLKERALNNKEKGLVEFIDDNKINVKEVVQSVPLENAPFVFEYDVIKPTSKLIKGSKKILGVFD